VVREPLLLSTPTSVSLSAKNPTERVKITKVSGRGKLDLKGISLPPDCGINCTGQECDEGFFLDFSITDGFLGVKTELVGCEFFSESGIERVCITCTLAQE
jgi:hypothetical protein